MKIIFYVFGICYVLYTLSIHSVEGMIMSRAENATSARSPFLLWWNLFNRRTTTPPFTFSKTCVTCKCGAPNLNRRIVGGQETRVNQYPWVGMLMHNGRFYCGVSLINDRYVLTASHCVNGFRRESMTLRFLQHNRNIANNEIIERTVARVIQHPNYVAKTFDNDISLLLLNSPIKFDEKIHPVCLPEGDQTFVGEYGLVTGWGALSETGQVSNTLQEVLVPIIDNAQCSKAFDGEITKNMFCAGYKLGQKDACQGDSGGPLHIIQNSEYQIAGIVSWGDGCARPNLPGVYARVNRYLHWIKATTTDACYC